MSLIVQEEFYRQHPYDWAYEAWIRHQQMHWIHTEIPLSDDVKDWKINLTEEDRAFIGNVLKLFTQMDVSVGAGYHDLYIPKFKNNDVRNMLGEFAAREAVHQSAYAVLVEQLGLTGGFSSFMEHQEMIDKHEHMLGGDMSTPEGTLKSIALFAACSEGISLFASFAMLLNYTRYGLMKGMGQIVGWSVRDENEHVEGCSRLFREYAAESGALTDEVKQDIRMVVGKTVSLELAFIDMVFGDKEEVNGLKKDDMHRYMYHIADFRLRQLGLQPIFSELDNPLPWIQELTAGVEHTNFFENKATAYGRGATKGDWGDVW